MWKILFLSCLMHIAIGIDIECDYESNDADNFYFCTVTNLRSYDSRITVDSVKGRHLARKTNDNVQGIFMKYMTSADYIPQKIENFFKNINTISIESCEIRAVMQSDLKAFPQLKNLFLPGNYIDTIDNDIFAFNPELEVIDLSDNNISHIDTSAFDHLDHLKHLDLSQNKCSESFFEDTPFREVIGKIKKGGCISTLSLIIRIDKEIRTLKSQMNDLNSKISVLVEKNGKSA